ncbi:MAG TPA: hypothetical protein VNN07_05775 [Candidatus Tectomicrobia bacterium]|nr:hypothetical protein [Candidatus Tectomicrobia bacterium]
MQELARHSIAGLALLACLALAAPVPAAAHIVEVTTSVPVADAEDPARLKEALRAEVDRVLETTIAFKPTIVALTDARPVGDRLLVRLLLADADGERLLQELERESEGSAAPKERAGGGRQTSDATWL